MIFITVGSQKFQFNRLLKEIDLLVDEGFIEKNTIFAQTGFSTYIPRNYNYKSFLNKDEFAKVIERSDLIISHGGTGSIIAGVKKGLKVICIPRDMKYGEHVDNHQYEIVEQFAKTNMILGVYKISDLKIALTNVKNIKLKKYYSNTENIIKVLEENIQKEL